MKPKLLLSFGFSKMWSFKTRYNTQSKYIIYILSSSKPKKQKKKKTTWKVLYFSKKNFLNFGMTANQVVR